MARTVGIDPGTVTFDVCGLVDGEVFLDRSLPTAEIVREPESLISLLSEGGVPDLIAGPSGYGLPLVPIDRLDDRDFLLAFLPADPGTEEGIIGLRRVVAALREARLPVVFTPGVIHLPTVPGHRKANRIDMGTADKVCAAVLAVEERATRLDLAYEEVSFVLVELGGAFTAVLAVEGGRLVDGQGGSSGPMGWRAHGAMDGEVACLLGRCSKEVLFTGGAAYVAGAPDAKAEELARGAGRAAAAREALVESVVKSVAGECALVPGVREILLSGRLSRVEWLAGRLGEELSRFAPVRRLEGFARMAEEAAQGAALVAEGLAGGARRRLIRAMEIDRASGTVLDHLYVAGTGRIREELLG